MCRLLVLKSVEPVLLAHLITRPSHSIISQASDARLRLDSGSTNADGFGIGWYDEVPTPSSSINPPCVFQAITPAWSNRNLHRLADRIKSSLVFAHVRASTSGSLSEDNCHPFQFGQILWMHNGAIAEFQKLKRPLQMLLKDRYYEVPQGNTDSEWSFALFLNCLDAHIDPNAGTIPHAKLKEAMLETIWTLNRLAKEANVTEPSLMNFCVSDGQSVVATRYISSRHDEAASLYYSTGSQFEEYEQGGHYRMTKSDKRERIVLIASEPLTFEKADWLEIPCQTIIVIDPSMNVLTWCIDDEFALAGMYPDRDSQFIQSRGYRFNSAQVAR
ncbi:uncharacterized protein L969DRAFT_73584 [Mixia osmundae IAM 14324]|uniref:Glutamine amidotransferase type-2 domain-containing protein n=1 Tax=Mixia osmundae (strain CBS 9802 / IAM 14324 / JCM 22182 / KY 12970) TaxID=764103 RepID=G7E8Q8_MIXOS|nr:uncharacterized protein L969DRAFT_73584 [Mixia osmundae IAM 14324]KEI40162.1 hypothetical protein L969DRAFT_73584 [Mixia osmundae IAM 14324]GAA99526.1 hypothetical protein E5Q_06227 [Mixia osmundae IAM 14324]